MNVDVLPSINKGSLADEVRSTAESVKTLFLLFSIFCLKSHHQIYLNISKTQPLSLV